MVVGQAHEMMVQRVQGRRGQHTGLAQTAAQHLARASGDCDDVRRPDQRGGNRCARALVEADRRRVIQPGDPPCLGPCVAVLVDRRHRRIEQPRAIQACCQTVPPGPGPWPRPDSPRAHLAAEGVLRRQQAGAGALNGCLCLPAEHVRTLVAVSLR